MKGNGMQKFKRAGTILGAIAMAASVSCGNLQKKPRDNSEGLILLLLATSASQASASTFTGSCSEGSACIDYYSWTQSAASSDCTAVGGSTYHTTACATNQVASCKVANKGNFAGPSGTIAIYRYYTAYGTTGAMLTNCNSNGGSFTTP